MNTLFPIIDFHAHLFPEKIASKAVSAIGEYYSITMEGIGVEDDLLSRGSAIGVQYWVVHSSATTARQVEPINTFISEICSRHKNVIGFGTLHPGMSSSELSNEISRIKSAGLRGIKFHPEFQKFTIDDDSMLPLYELLSDDLPILIHMGDASKDSSHPRRLARILSMFPELTVVAAHLGGYRMWDDSIIHLAGKNLYFDTSSALFALKPNRAVEIIRTLGVEKTLFGTDYPMWDPAGELTRFMALPLNDKERSAILWENAAKLLNIIL